jgi:hypothetical protein
LKLWKTKPSARFRTSASWLRLMRDTSRPASRYRPEVGRSRQPTMLINVDLPDPEAPITATKARSPMVREIPRRAGTSTSPIR